VTGTRKIAVPAGSPTERKCSALFLATLCEVGLGSVEIGIVRVVEVESPRIIDAPSRESIATGVLIP
jgi:hypothetical protein